MEVGDSFGLKDAAIIIGLTVGTLGICALVGKLIKKVRGLEGTDDESEFDRIYKAISTGRVMRGDELNDEFGVEPKLDRGAVYFWDQSAHEWKYLTTLAKAGDTQSVMYGMMKITDLDWLNR